MDSWRRRPIRSGTRSGCFNFLFYFFQIFLFGGMAYLKWEIGGRDYEAESERQKSVEEFYRINHINQTYDFVS